MSTSTSAHTAPLIKREEIAEGTMAFHFAKPADFQFRAGQSMDLTLLNPETDAEGNSQAFSIASAWLYRASAPGWQNDFRARRLFVPPAIGRSKRRAHSSKSLPTEGRRGRSSFWLLDKSN